jgi:hypothetical protein
MQNPIGLSLEESYVLAIRIEPYRVVFTMDFVLTPEHPMYRPPLAGERACFRRGLIAIRNFQRLAWDSTGYSPSTDASGELDFGTLDRIVNLDGMWMLSGDWGDLQVNGGEISISVDTQGAYEGKGPSQVS